MSKASQIQAVERINAAYRLLEQKMQISDVANTLSHRFSISRRQAYRYVEEAVPLTNPLEVPEPKDVFTVKLPINLIARLRNYPRPQGQSLSDFIAAALHHALSLRGDDGREENLF